MITIVGAASDDVARLFVELGAIFFGLAVLARVSYRFGLSPIPFYLLAGVAFGEGGIAPLDLSHDFIEVTGEIGVVLLLLALGLEYTPAELTAGLRSSVAVGAIGLGVNFTPGFLAAFLLGWGLETAVLLGGITYISSSSVVAKLLRDFGRLGNRETPAVLSILVIEDLVMALYLPAIGLMLAGGGGSPTATILLVVVLICLALVVAFRFGSVLTRLVRTESDEALLLGVLGLTLVAAGLAQQAELSTAIGAFLVGVALASDVSHRAQLLISPLRDLFAATFFVIFGFDLDPREIPRMLPVATGLAIATAVSTIFLGRWAARRAGAGLRGQMRAGTVLIARGEFSIVIAGLALAGGDKVHPDLGVLTATYVLILAIVGPILTRYADPLADRITARD